MVNKHS
jgi:hypothetical protein